MTQTALKAILITKKLGSSQFLLNFRDLKSWQSVGIFQVEFANMFELAKF